MVSTALPQPPSPPLLGEAHHHSAKPATKPGGARAPFPTTLPRARGRSHSLCPLQQAGAAPLSTEGEFIPNPTGIFTRRRVATLVSAYPVQLSILNQAQMQSFSKEMLLLIKRPSEEKTVLLPLPLQTSPLTLLQLSGDTSCLWTCPR